jgi:fatty acid synthase subunit alpha
MIEKSASKCYAPHTRSRWSHFKFLSSAENKNDVYYEYQERIEDNIATNPAVETNEKDAVNVTLKVEVKTSPAKVVEAHLGEISSVAGPVVVADASLTAAHVVLAITAQKLKRAFDQVSSQKTIRDLSGGTFEQKIVAISSKLTSQP